MKNVPMLFENHEVEIIEVNGQILFNPRHVGACLEITESTVRDHIKNMSDKQVIKLTNSAVDNPDIRKFNSMGENFLTESGVYKLVFKSGKPEAEKFQDWVTDTVLPAIRKTGTYSLADSIKEKIPAMEFDTVALEMAIRILKPSENSKLIMVGKLYDKHGADRKLLPSYTENVRAIFSATKLLEDIGNPFTVRTFNKKMIGEKYLEKKTRKSSKDNTKTKEFLSLTEKGLFYGQNDVSPVNPLETQPHYYENTFKELVDKLSGI